MTLGKNGQIDNRLEPRKYVDSSSISASCVWKIFGWDERTRLMYPTGFPTKISHC